MGAHKSFPWMAGGTVVPLAVDQAPDLQKLLEGGA